MKKIFSAFIITCIANILMAQHQLHITTRANNTNWPIHNATIIIKKDKKLIGQSISNRFGESMFDLENGKYSITIIAIGFDTLKNETIVINNLNARKVFLFTQSVQKHTANNIIVKEKIVRIGKKSMLKKTMYESSEKAIHSPKDVPAKIYKDEDTRKEKLTTKSLPSIKAITTSSDKRKHLTVISATERESLATPSSMLDAIAPAPTTKAGTLTTGEVNDFKKWKLYEDVSRDDLNKHLQNWQYYMERRYCVQAINANNNPVVNAIVHLLQDGKIVWQSKTDNTGKAELWAGIHEKENNKKCTIQLMYEGKTYLNLSPTLFESGINFFQLPVDCIYSNDVDIAFVVDATGSMGDEIQFLKSELNDILGRAQNVNKILRFNTGSVFYQDYGDEYTTVKSDFTNTIATTKSFIDTKNAGGGGDFPEAVDEALTVAIHEMNWRENARAKLLFLVLDAPPHADSATQNRFNQLVADASAQGIRIIPVTASGINKNVEYIMRSVALATNGTYTFLTNHSGVGNSHIEPSTDSFKIEKMNDLLIRLITQFTYIPQCNTENTNITKLISTDSIKISDENPFNEWRVTNTIAIYPNPNQGIFFIDIPKGNTEILITDIAGKVLKRIISVNHKKVEIDISQFASGIYFVRVLDSDKWITGKVIKQ